MPEVCRFHNIRIIFNSREHHNIEHFHVVHPDFNASVEIRPASILAGRIPSNFRVLVLERAREHREELLDGWRKVRIGTVPDKIAPPTRR